MRYAALLHDIGHLPFSHASEKVILGPGKAHEDITKFIIEYYEPIRGVISDSGVDPKIVGTLIRGHITSQFNLTTRTIESISLTILSTTAGV